MRFTPGSLRKKVALGYLIGFLLMVVVAGINWRNLMYVEKMVLAGERVSDLFDATLEVRRFEKNFFLYGKDEDFKELLFYIDKVESILSGNSHEIGLFATKGQIDEIKGNIAAYKNSLKAIRRLEGWESSNIWEERIRQKGKAIVTGAEAMSLAERRIIQDTLRSAGRTLLYSIVMLMTAGLIGGIFFYKMFHGPLSFLETHMKKIAQGDFHLVPIKYKDRELVSLGSAFNRMLVELEARQRHLMHSEKLASLGTLLFGVAHELNNPLSNISTSCQILKEEIQEADIEYKKELLSQIESETDRAREIVRSLLDFSKGGKKEKISVLKTIEESLRFIKVEIPPRIVVRIDVPTDMFIFADRQKLQQAFLNLIKNSIEAMQDVGQIDISAQKTPKHIEITFKDNGMGIEQDLISRIFDPFFTTKEGRSGHGLGLFIVHNIIKEHGGEISVESEPQRGTEFHIKLPIGEEIDEQF